MIHDLGHECSASSTTLINLLGIVVKLLLCGLYYATKPFVTAFEITPQGKKVWEAKVKVPYVGMLRRVLDSTELWLIVVGGIAYTVGAVVYAVKRPNPWPRTFGYHEIFHTLTLVGAGLHLAAVTLIVRSAAA